MKLQRTLMIRLSEDEAATLDALGFIHRRPWTSQTREVIRRWLAQEARRPEVAAAIETKRRYQRDKRLHLVEGGENTSKLYTGGITVHESGALIFDDLG